MAFHSTACCFRSSYCNRDAQPRFLIRCFPASALLSYDSLSGNYQEDWPLPPSRHPPA